MPSCRATNPGCRATNPGSLIPAPPCAPPQPGAHIPFVLLIREQRSGASGSRAGISCHNTGQKALLLSHDTLHCSSFRKETPQNKKINPCGAREAGARADGLSPHPLRGCTHPRSAPGERADAAGCPRAGGQLDELATGAGHGPCLLTPCTPQHTLPGLVNVVSESILHVRLHCRYQTSHGSVSEGVRCPLQV